MCKIIIKYVCINIIKTLISYLVSKFKCGCVLTKSLGREGGREGEREREREREKEKLELGVKSKHFLFSFSPNFSF